MRTERNKDGTWNVWMSREEYHELPRSASSFQREIAIRLMGDCGLRVAETLDVAPEHVTRTKDGHHHQLEVVWGRTRLASTTAGNTARRGYLEMSKRRWLATNSRPDLLIQTPSSM